MKIKKKYIAIILIALGIGACSLKSVVNKNKVSSYSVSSISAEKSNLDLSYDLNGIIEVEKKISIFSNTVAEVIKVNYRQGDEVKKGDILAVLKSETGNNDELLLEKSKLAYEESKKNYDNLKQIYEAGGISKSELDNAELNMKNNLISYQVNKNNKKDFSPNIVSPITGVILSSDIDVNYKVDPSKALFTIADIENLKLVLEIPNSKAKNIKEGQLVLASSDSLETNETIKGYVSNVSKISFKSSKSNENITRVTVNLEDYKNLKPGDRVEAKIVYDSIKDKIILPLQYLVFINDKVYAYVNNKGVVELRNVTLGANDGINYIIESGLDSGDIVIDNSTNIYKQGDKIK